MSNTLYYSPGACSLAAHIVLEEIGEPYEAVSINLRSGDNKKPEFLAVNPRGKVPAMKVDGGVLTENVAILSYLADSHPAAKLFPAPGDGLERAKAMSLLAFCSTTIHPAFLPFFGAARMVEGEAAQAQLIAFGKKNVERWFEEVNELVKGKAYALGDSLSVIDPYLVVFWRWATSMKVDFARFDGYRALAERVQARPAAKRVLAAEGLS